MAISGRGTLGVPLLFLFVLLWSLPLSTVHLAHGSEPPKVVVIDDFEAGLSGKWQLKHFLGQTIYEVTSEVESPDGNKVLRATTEGGASGLIYQLDIDLHTYPVLTWRWKVDGVFPKGDATIKSGDDYPARVYVAFPGWIPLTTTSINYIWANKLPKGAHIPSTFNSKFIMVAQQSGDANAGEWITERRNIIEDYKKLFGKPPPRIGAVAIMTDGDQTGGSAIAHYDDLRFESDIEGRVPLDTGAPKR